jgi:hypothetical protein
VDGALEQLYGEGVHAYFAGNADLSHRLLTDAIKAGSRDPRCYYFRGLAAARTGADAHADFQVAAELEGSNQDVVTTVNHALQRIQGRTRMVIENHRVAARYAALRQQRDRDTSRYGTDRRRQIRDLEQKAAKPAEAATEPAPAEVPADAKPADAKPMEEMPAEEPAEEAKPAEEAPAEEAPAAEKPADEPPAAAADEKPAAETPAEEAPAADAEPAEDKPAADEKPAEAADSKTAKGGGTPGTVVAIGGAVARAILKAIGGTDNESAGAPRAAQAPKKPAAAAPDERAEAPAAATDDVAIDEETPFKDDEPAGM